MDLVSSFSSYFLTNVLMLLDHRLDKVHEGLQVEMDNVLWLYKQADRVKLENIKF